MGEIYPFEFSAPLERFGVGKSRKIWYNVLFLPAELRAQLPFNQYPRLRVEGEIADHPIENAFIPAGDGRNYVIVGPEIMEGADLTIGREILMRFAIADQDHVDVPEELEKRLAGDRHSERRWKALTPGKKRMLAQHVRSAKTDTTRSRRIEEALEALNNFSADLKAWRNAKKSDR